LGRADDRRLVTIDAALVAEFAEMGVAPENLPAGAGPGDAEVFADLQVMEAAALAVFRESPA